MHTMYFFCLDTHNACIPFFCIFSMIDTSFPICIVHVGKTSGTRLQHAMRAHSRTRHLRCHWIHHANKPSSIRRPIVYPKLVSGQQTQYIVTLRHPIHRWVSAFNFKLEHWHLGHSDHWANEPMVFQTYPTCNLLAEALYDKDGTPNKYAQRLSLDVDHLRFGIAHYISGLPAKRIKAVVRHEHFSEDLRRAFNIPPPRNEKKHQPRSNVSSDILSVRGLKNLQRWLVKDYAALRALHNAGLIDDAYVMFCQGIGGGADAPCDRASRNIDGGGDVPHDVKAWLRPRHTQRHAAWRRCVAQTIPSSRSS